MARFKQRDPCKCNQSHKYRSILISLGLYFLHSTLMICLFRCYQKLQASKEQCWQYLCRLQGIMISFICRSVLYAHKNKMEKGGKKWSLFPQSYLSSFFHIYKMLMLISKDYIHLQPNTFLCKFLAFF